MEGVKAMSNMVKIYEKLIIKGEKTIDEVPEDIREDVREELIKDGYPEKA